MKLSTKDLLTELNSVKLNRKDKPVLIESLGFRLFASSHLIKRIANALKHTKVTQVNVILDNEGEQVALAFGTSLYTLNTIPTGEY